MKTQRTLTPSILLFVLVAGMIIGLSSCSLFCKHEWKDATCTTPKTCNLCNKTEGNALGHTFNLEIVKAEALKSEATCANANVYYKSCACGAISTNASDVFFEGTVKRHQYKNNICTVCGLDATNPYYLNFLSSFATNEGISIVLNNLVIEVESTGDAYHGEFEKFNTVDVAELEISIKDGELSGAAHGKFNLSMDNLDIIIDFKAILADGYLYITTQESQHKFDIQEVITTALDQMGGSMESSGINAELITLVTDKIVPMIEDLYNQNKAYINEFVGSVLNMFFTFEKQADGSVLVTLSKDKVLALNEDLATKPVAQVIDAYFGADLFDEIVNTAFEILDLKICEIPTYLKDNGIDYDGLVAQIEELLPLFGISEELDIDDLLKNSEISDSVIGQLIFGVEDDSYKAEIEENGVKPLREKALYTLIGAPEEFADQVKEVVNQIFDVVALTFNTKADGSCTAMHVNINKFELGGSEDSFGNSSTTTLSLSLDVIANGKINVTWGNIVNEINGAIVPMPEEVKEEKFTFDNDSWSWTDVISFNGQNYYGTYCSVYVYEKDYDSVILTSILPSNDDNLVNYQMQVLQKEYDYDYFTCYEGDEVKIFLRDPYNYVWVQIEEISDGYHITHDNGFEEDIYLAKEDSNELTIFKLFLTMFGEVGYNTDLSAVDFSYNPVTGQYSLEP